MADVFQFEIDESQSDNFDADDADELILDGNDVSVFLCPFQGNLIDKIIRWDVYC